MSFLLKKIIWYTNGDTTLPIELTDVLDISIVRGLDAKNNKAVITLKNALTTRSDLGPIHKYINEQTGLLSIKKGDTIEVFLKNTNSNEEINTSTTTDLVITLDIEETALKYTNKMSKIELNCIDKTFSLLSKLWSFSYIASQNINSPEIIKDIIRNSTETGESGSQYGYETVPTGNTGSFVQLGQFDIDARLVSESGYIQSTRPNSGGLYPDISLGKTWKPIYEWVEELSQVQFTNSAAEIAAGTEKCLLKHIYFVDKENRFHWEYPDNEEDYTFITGQVNDDGDIYDINVKKSSFDVVNTVFFSAGKDLNNVNVLGYFYDTSSDENKLKTKFMPYTDICVNLRRAEVNNGNITINEDDTITINNSSGTTSWGEAYSTENDFKDKFFDFATSLAEARAKRFTTKRGSPRWKGTITIKGKVLNAGEIVNLTAYPIGIVNQNLRIQKLTHKINKTGWTTFLDVEEDERVNV